MVNWAATTALILSWERRAAFANVLTLAQSRRSLTDSAIAATAIIVNGSTDMIGHVLAAVVSNSDSRTTDITESQGSLTVALHESRSLSTERGLHSNELVPPVMEYSTSLLRGLDGAEELCLSCYHHIYGSR